MQSLKLLFAHNVYRITYNMKIVVHITKLMCEYIEQNKTLITEFSIIILQQ